MAGTAEKHCKPKEKSTANRDHRSCLSTQMTAYSLAEKSGRQLLWEIKTFKKTCVHCGL